MTWSCIAVKKPSVSANKSAFFVYYDYYKLVQIWPGLFVCKSGDISPGHIWTTLYYYYYYYYYYYSWRFALWSNCLKDCFKHFQNLSSAVLVYVEFTSAFVVKIPCNVSANNFNFSCSVVATLSFSFKGRMSVVSFVRCLYILHLSCKLLVSRFWTVWFQLLQSWVLMALFIFSFEAFMWVQKGRLCVLCH